jgi:hypothetical protein
MTADAATTVAMEAVAIKVVAATKGAVVTRAAADIKGDVLPLVVPTVRAESLVPAMQPHRAPSDMVFRLESLRLTTPMSMSPVGVTNSGHSPADGNCVELAQEMADSGNDVIRQSGRTTISFLAERLSDLTKNRAIKESRGGPLKFCEFRAPPLILSTGPDSISDVMILFDGPYVS